MKVIYALGKAKVTFKNAVLAIGVFDGMHLGHQYLIRKVIAKARAISGTAVVMTFFPHPVHVLHPEVKLSYLVSLSHRLRLIEEIGADVAIVMPFTMQFSRLSPAQFIEKYLAKTIKPKEIFVGDDFRFGQDRRGDLDFFQAEGKLFGFHVNIIPSVTGSGEAIKSSRIRKLIADGDLESAARLLGRRVSIFGKVTRGDSRGKTLGFPTANLSAAQLAIPPIGVYAVSVAVGKKKFGGMCNIGRRPSFKANGPVTGEVHIFDFKQNLYSKEILVEFIKKIRDEKKFSSPERLIAQLQSDEKKARALTS